MQTQNSQSPPLTEPNRSLSEKPKGTAIMSDTSDQTQVLSAPAEIEKPSNKAVLGLPILSTQATDGSCGKLAAKLPMAEDRSQLRCQSEPEPCIIPLELPVLDATRDSVQSD